LDDPGPAHRSAPEGASGDDRLDSWKRIATYLKRDVSTVQRWERREGMPVHRHQHDKLGSVFAFRSELDAWWSGRRGDLAADDATHEPAVSTQPVVGTQQRFVSAAIAVCVLLGAAVALIAYSKLRDPLERSPLADAKFRPIADLGGAAQAAAISRDGAHVAFIAAKDGRFDAWLGDIDGGGNYRNLTNGGVRELVNPAARTLGFSADSADVLIWTRQADGTRPDDVGIVAAPLAGGPLRTFLAGAAELDSSHDGKRFVYHTTAPGDPLFVRDTSAQPGDKDLRIYVAADGVHCHFPVWSPDDAYIYFVRGVPPADWDLWRVPANGGAAEQITRHAARIAYPVMLDERTVLYLAEDAQGAGPWIYAIDVERRIPHRVSLGVETFTSLAGSADAARLVTTVDNPRTSIWRVRLNDGAASPPAPLVSNGMRPRTAGAWLYYVSESAGTQSLWRIGDGDSRREIWRDAKERIVGGPAISSDLQKVAFVTADPAGATVLEVVGTDGTPVRRVLEGRVLRGDPSWSPDGASLAVAVVEGGEPHLTRVTVDGTAPFTLTQEYALTPAWSPDGKLIVYSGADVGTTFPVRAAASDGRPYPLPGIMLTRGARRLRFLPDSRSIAALTGGIGHKNVSVLDLVTGASRVLADIPADFTVRDFDISADGTELLLERWESNSHLALIERSRF
jgi:Tol biopolymer transport system component